MLKGKKNQWVSYEEYSQLAARVKVLETLVECLQAGRSERTGIPFDGDPYEKIPWYYRPNAPQKPPPVYCIGSGNLPASFGNEDGSIVTTNTPYNWSAKKPGV